MEGKQVKEDMEARLLEGGVRPTAMRLLISKFMLQQDTAVALTDIENAFAKVERTTIYRAIKTFEEKGIVHQIDDGTGIQKYALCEPGCKCDIARDLHLHFHCSNCNQTVCLTNYKLPHINLPQGYSAEDISLVVTGICKKCGL